MERTDTPRFVRRVRVRRAVHIDAGAVYGPKAVDAPGLADGKNIFGPDRPPAELFPKPRFFPIPKPPPPDPGPGWRYIAGAGNMAVLSECERDDLCSLLLALQLQEG